jgi:hypothetical protein
MAVRREILKNNAQTLLNGSINNSVTSIDVDDGSVFPATGDFRVLVEDEIMLVTGRSTNNLTVVRGREGTAAASHSDDRPITHVLTEGAVNQYQRDAAPHFSHQPPFRIVSAANVPLTSADFTEINGSTNPTPVDNPDGSIFVAKASSSSAVDWSIYARSYTAPKTLIVAMRGMFMRTGSGSSFNFGIGVRQDGGTNAGRFHAIHFTTLGQSGGENLIAVTKYTNAATKSADYVFPASGIIPSDTLWFKIEDNNTNIISSFSFNGINWVQFHSVSRTDFMTDGPNQFFWGVNNVNNVSWGAYAELLAWDEGA